MSFDRPDPLPEVRRRPFDEVLAEFAERTGRPCWPVTRTSRTATTPQNITDSIRVEMWLMRREGMSVEDIARELNVSVMTVYRGIDRVNRQPDLQRRWAA